MTDPQAAFEAWAVEQWLWTDTTRKLDAARASFLAGHAAASSALAARVGELEKALEPFAEAWTFGVTLEGGPLHFTAPPARGSFLW